MTTFEQIKSEIDKVDKLISLFETELGDLYSRDAILKEFDFKLRTREAEIDGKLKGITEMEKHQKEEQEYIKRTQTEQTIRENHIKDEVKTLEDKRLAIATQSANLDIQKKDVEVLISKYAGLKDKENELAGREAILSKEKTIDIERKQILDIREKKNETERVRLQRISDRLTQ